VILEDWLWTLVLDYDPYESSKAQAVHDTLCGNESVNNDRILKAAWDAMPEEQWQEMLSRKIEEAEFTLKKLKGMLDPD